MNVGVIDNVALGHGGIEPEKGVVWLCDWGDFRLLLFAIADFSGKDKCVKFNRYEEILGDSRRGSWVCHDLCAGRCYGDSLVPNDGSWFKSGAVYGCIRHL